MAQYVEDIQFRKFAFIDVDDTDATDDIELALASAEVEVDNDLDYASLSDYATDGVLPAPLIKAILMKALANYTDRNDYTHSGISPLHNYEKTIKPYVKLVKDTTTSAS